MALVALVVFAATFLALMGGARADVLATLQDSSATAERAVQLAKRGSVYLGALSLGSLSSAVAGPSAVVALVLCSVTRERIRERPLAIVGLGTALMINATSVASLVFAYELITGLDRVANTDAGAVQAAWSAILAEADAAVRIGRAAVVVSAGLSIVAAAAVGLRASWVPGARAWLGAAFLVACGAGAFAMTRDLAHDAELAITPTGAATRGSPYGIDAPDLDRCANYPPPLQRTLTIAERAATLDEEHVLSPGALEEALAREPGGWGRLTLLAEATTPARSLAPWLRAAQRAEYPQIHVLGEQTTRIETRTFGDVEWRVPCATELTLDADGRPLAHFATWQALARAAGQARGQLRVAP